MFKQVHSSDFEFDSIFFEAKGSKIKEILFG
jgi:hypothetical protein